MTRFKELKRIESAIEHKNQKELDWALWYCQERLSSAAMKQHQKHWSKIIAKINDTQDEINGGKNT